MKKRVIAAVPLSSTENPPNLKVSIHVHVDDKSLFQFVAYCMA